MEEHPSNRTDQSIWDDHRELVGRARHLKKKGQCFDPSCFAVNSFASSAKAWGGKSAKDKTAPVNELRKRFMRSLLRAKQEVIQVWRTNISLQMTAVENLCVQINWSALRKECVRRSLCLQPSITEFEYKPLLTAVSRDNKAGHIFAYHRAGWSWAIKRIHKSG